MKVVIEAPWGIVEYSEINSHAAVSRTTVNFGLKQLRYLYENGNKTEYLERDISGYELLLDQEDEVIYAFLTIKQEAIRNGHRFKDNLAVIEFLKQKGLWV